MTKGYKLLAFFFVSLSGFSCAVDQTHRRMVGTAIDGKDSETLTKLERIQKARGQRLSPEDIVSKTGGPRRLKDKKRVSGEKIVCCFVSNYIIEYSCPRASLLTFSTSTCYNLLRSRAAEAGRRQVTRLLWWRRWWWWRLCTRKQVIQRSLLRWQTLVPKDTVPDLRPNPRNLPT